MTIIDDYTAAYYSRNNFVDSANFQTSLSSKESKTLNFFEQLYSSPQKLTLKWESLATANKNLPDGIDNQFNNSISKWDPDYSRLEEATQDKYLLPEYKKGFLDKLSSSKFYSSQAKEIHTSLSSIPVFLILNGDNEIITNRMSTIGRPSNVQSSVDKVIYNICGAFDLNSQTQNEFGFFFFNQLDAENYLTNVAKTDIDGTKTVGLSIHCTGLDAAYKIVREYHPEIDFRFIPNLNSLKNSKNSMVGVPIFIVEFLDQSTNLAKKFVFFDQSAAKVFYKNKVDTVRGIRKLKPKFSLTSLENFLEDWEEQIQERDYINKTEESSFSRESVYFVPISENGDQDFNIPHRSKGKIIIQSLGQKTRILKRFLGTFFSVK